MTEINGVRQNEDSLRDTFSVPPATNDGPGVLKVHCHAVDHEDKGMMGVVEVVA